MSKLFLLLGSILGGTGVMIGAFGAHGLKKMLTANNQLANFETAVKYQFYHAFALIVTGLIILHLKDKMLDYAGYCFFAGTIIFSGSLYILALTGITKLGAITPIGGLLMIIGWILLVFSVLKMA